MEKISPPKSSSRAGRFRKKLVSEPELLLEATIVRTKLAPFHELFLTGSLTAAEFCGCYCMVFLSHRFPGTWLGSKRGREEIPGIYLRDLPFHFEPNIQARLPKTLMEVFTNFALKSTPLSVNRAILEWNRKKYGLELMFRIPLPHEVLQQQKVGRRCVTTILDERMNSYILGERDALSFTMHDLIHADHFYHDNLCYEGQLGFYGLLDKTIGYFDLTHKEFASEFEYVIADMNAYPIHLMKCLKSAIIHYFNEKTFLHWLIGLNAPRAVYTLNTKSYSAQEMDQEILDWLKTFRFTSPS
jgi:hypothetical protein